VTGVDVISAGRSSGKGGKRRATRKGGIPSGSLEVDECSKSAWSTPLMIAV